MRIGGLFIFWYLLQFLSSNTWISCHISYLDRVTKRCFILFVAIVKNVVFLLLSQPICHLYIRGLLIFFLFNLVFCYFAEVFVSYRSTQVEFLGLLMYLVSYHLQIVILWLIYALTNKSTKHTEEHPTSFWWYSHFSAANAGLLVHANPQNYS